MLKSDTDFNQKRFYIPPFSFLFSFSKLRLLQMFRKDKWAQATNTYSTCSLFFSLKMTIIEMKRSMVIQNSKVILGLFFRTVVQNLHNLPKKPEINNWVLGFLYFYTSFLVSEFKGHKGIRKVILPSICLRKCSSYLWFVRHIWQDQSLRCSKSAQ